MAAGRRFQGDWAGRVLNDGKVTGLFADYHYYGTGDIGGAPHEESVRRLEAIVTKGTVDLPRVPGLYPTSRPQDAQAAPETQVGLGPVHVISATADQMFKDITPAEEANLPRYTGEMELTNHSAGSLTSQAYQKRWIRREELLADAAEKSSLVAQWLSARRYPMERLNGAWTLAMAAHFHDLAAGTATPRAYQFAWNDDVIAMNQFSTVLKSATEGVLEALDTRAKGVPVVVFNQLNIPRQDAVEANVRFEGKIPKAVRVTGPDGAEVPAQVSDGKVIFLASVPSVGYAVYDVQEANAPAVSSDLHVTDNRLENAYYRVTLNAAGDVESIFDKKLNRELLAAPARLALSYDNPTQWPAWNMDWDQEQAVPREYVSGPAKVRIVENGAARIAIQVERETDGSRFVQTIRLSAGDAGKRVEFANVIDWATRERNLKAVFPLTASNEMATYNWDIGTIQRPTAKPRKFEVASHQWIDLTDASGTFGATVLTDAKNGSDKPNDHTLRLTLIRTPGVSGGYPDQATQDIGHHEFVYGFAGHAEGWRRAQTDWQGQRLNAPLLSFAADKHPGALGRSFSALKISDPRIRVLGMKRAENSDEWILRMVELDGTPKENVHVSLVAAISGAREVNGQEQPVGPATVSNGELVTSFNAYQPRTFALRLASAPTSVATVRSAPIKLQYTTATATTAGSPTTDGFDGKGNALPAEMLPQQISFNGVDFHLAPAATGAPNAIAADGQTLQLPEGKFDRVYLLAAAANGDQEADFAVGGHRQTLKIEDWGGFIGQWDDRIWSSESTHGSYGQMIGLRPGFIKRADLAWYSDHHHDAAGKNVAYRYSYLFAYVLDVPPGARTLTLPHNSNIRILAASAANRDTEAMPLHPLYDVLPSANSAAPGFALLTPATLSVPQGRAVSRRIVVLPYGSLDGPVKIGLQGLPSGVTVDDSYDAKNKTYLLSLNASANAAPGEFPVHMVATSGEIRHEQDIPLTVTPILRGTVPVDLGPAFNVTAIYKRGTKFNAGAGADGGGYAFAEETLGGEQLGDGVVFRIGPPNAPDAVSAKTIKLPGGHYASIRLLATAVRGNQRQQVFTINYADGSSETPSLNLTDWAASSTYRRENEGIEVPYRLTGNGNVDDNPFHLWSYTLETDSAKELKSISLPENRNVLVIGVTLIPAKQ